MTERSMNATFLGRVGAVLLLLLNLFFASILLMAVAGKGMVDRTIQHSRQLEAEFKEAARSVDTFRAQHGRLPTTDEINQHLLLDGPYIVEVQDGFSQEAASALGQPPEGGYILGLWRGEWMEYYASWSGATTMPFHESAYYLTASRIGDCLLGMLGMILCMAGAVRLWRGRRRDGRSANRAACP